LLGVAMHRDSTAIFMLYNKIDIIMYYIYKILKSANVKVSVYY